MRQEWEETKGTHRHDIPGADNKEQGLKNWKKWKIFFSQWRFLLVLFFLNLVLVFPLIIYFKVSELTADVILIVTVVIPGAIYSAIFGKDGKPNITEKKDHSETDYDEEDDDDYYDDSNYDDGDDGFNDYMLYDMICNK